ncbi:hypothetical protein BLNAU_21995 [Blattamonas nauphoetae]|uniref:Uncharacterized protein n=1 Tax=Blattamonas nauphoetae TaxID=2049346 RepID=A0ABQ9WUA0_9EUKA|nr:hypothetical protein BLNAU_21995 [Blattamonas nauphoetae]
MRFTPIRRAFSIPSLFSNWTCPKPSGHPFRVLAISTLSTPQPSNTARISFSSIDQGRFPMNNLVFDSREEKSYFCGSLCLPCFRRSTPTDDLPLAPPREPRRNLPKLRGGRRARKEGRS